MRNVFFYFLLIILFIISCGRNEKDIPIYSYSLATDSVHNFNLNSNTKNIRTNFEYLHKKDTLRNLSIVYDNELDVLIYGSDTLQSTNRIYNAKSLKFKYYRKKAAVNHHRFLVFNEKYGLLSNLAYGANYLFLKDSISKSDKELVFKKLFLQVNKINIE